jgi:hypothetical protein
MQSARLYTAKGEQYRKDDNGSRSALALHHTIRIPICSEEARLTQRHDEGKLADVEMSMASCSRLHQPKLLWKCTCILTYIFA